MALSSLFALLLSVQPAVAAANRAPAMINIQFCRESSDSLKDFSPRELCDALGGFPCSNANNMAQAVCLSTGEGMCAFLKPSDDAKYLRRLRGLCKSYEADAIASSAAAKLSAAPQGARQDSVYQTVNAHDYDRTSIYGSEADGE